MLGTPVISSNLPLKSREQHPAVRFGGKLKRIQCGQKKGPPVGADGPINGVSRSHGGDGGAIGNGVQPPCAQPSGGPTIRWCRSRVLFAPVADLHQRCGGRAGWRTHQRASYWDSGPVRRITAAPRGGGPCYLNDRVHSTIRAALQLLSAPSDDPGLILKAAWQLAVVGTRVCQ